jgi:hypothetical protein
VRAEFAAKESRQVARNEQTRRFMSALLVGPSRRYSPCHRMPFQ